MSSRTVDPRLVALRAIGKSKLSGEQRTEYEKLSKQEQRKRPWVMERVRPVAANATEVGAAAVGAAAEASSSTGSKGAIKAARRVVGLDQIGPVPCLVVGPRREIASFLYITPYILCLQLFRRLLQNSGERSARFRSRGVLVAFKCV